MERVTTPISQTSGTLDGDASAFPEALQFYEAWLGKTAKLRLPQSTKGEVAHDIGTHAQIEVIARPDLWVSRFQKFSDPDHTWHVETLLQKTPEGQVFFGTRLECTHKQDERPPISLPGFVQPIVKEIGLFDEGYRLGYEPVRLTESSEINEVIGFILDRKRKRPVFIATMPKEQDEPLARADLIMRRVGPLGHCFVVPTRLTFNLTRELGNHWTVFGGSFRSFLPDFHPATSRFKNHPLLFPESLLRLQSAHPSLPIRCLFQAASASVSRKNEDTLPRFESFRKTFAAPSALAC